MMIVRNVLATILAVLIEFSICQQYSIPDPTIEAFTPKGLRVSIPDTPGIQLFGFHGKVNSQFSGTGAKEGGDIAKDTLKATSGLWIIEDENVQLEVGDSIYYWITVQYNNLGYRKENGRYHVANLTQRTAIPGEISGTPVSSCEPTATVINNNQKSCRGQLIFSEEFNSVDIDSTKWIVQNKFIDGPDYEFVLYQSSSLVVTNGTLQIQPSLLSDDDTFIRTGTMDINTSCTGKINSRECVRTAYRVNILPPTKSAQLVSSAFSFRYGTVEIRAKLPSGNWLYPELYLTPKDYEYGPEYASGVMRVAFLRGNRELQTKEGININSKELLGGFILGQQGSLQTFGMKSRFIRDGTWSDDFHTYKLVWSPEGVTVSVDGEEYGAIVYPDGGLSSLAKQNSNNLYAQRWNTPTAPFDKEFTITLGVGVGGLTDFPDESYSGKNVKPWRNKDPKYLISFWQKRSEWLPTWSSKESALQVDYVKVWAL